MQVDQAKNSLWSAQISRDAAGTAEGKANGSYDRAQLSVLNAEASVRQAEMELAELQEDPTDAELKSAKASVETAKQKLRDLQVSAVAVAEAKAQLAQAQENLEDLTGGPTEQEILSAEAAIKEAEAAKSEAELALEEAEEQLEDTELRAPIDGTVTELDAKVGQTIEAGSSFITLADLAHPLLEVYIDEADMDMIAVGYEAEVVFDAMPDTTFVGHVTQVDPSLMSQAMVSMVRGLVKLDETSYSKPEGLPMGMNATVEIIGGETADALLVPVEALREIDTDEYAVFVVESGTPVLRTVEVGLMDYTYAEILSGLEQGDVVSTGMVETQ